MSERKTAQGKNWVMAVFEHVRDEYREQVPGENVLPWRRGKTFEESREAQAPNGCMTYYLPFEVGQDLHHIPFTRSELADCWHPDNSAPRLAIKKRRLDPFKSLASE